MYRKSGGVGSQSGWTDLFRKGLFGRIRIATSSVEETARLTFQQTHDLLAGVLAQRRPGLDDAKEVSVEQCGG